MLARAYWIPVFQFASEGLTFTPRDHLSVALGAVSLPLEQLLMQDAAQSNMAGFSSSSAHPLYPRRTLLSCCEGSYPLGNLPSACASFRHKSSRILSFLAALLRTQQLNPSLSQVAPTLLVVSWVGNYRIQAKARPDTRKSISVSAFSRHCIARVQEAIFITPYSRIHSNSLLGDSKCILRYLGYPTCICNAVGIQRDELVRGKH